MDERGGTAGVPLPHAPPPPPHHHANSSNNRSNNSSSHHHHHMPGQHQHQHQQQYYASPHAQYASSPLPPIQQYQQSPHAPHHPPPPAHLVNHHPHYGVPPSFYSPNGMPSAPMMPSNVGVNGQRWPSPHVSTSSGAKQNSPKDVKRRTKTGCLTCRKRRIKCDEGQPTCNNCRKSKRPCMGYDPVFKGTTLSPQLIQPAPPPAGPSIPSESFSQPPPPPFQGSYLSSAASPLPPGRTSLDQPPLASSPYVPAMQSERRVKPLSMDMLFAIQDVPPRFENRDQPATIPPHQQQAIFDFYNFHYGPALNHLLETNWYTSSAYQYIQQSPSLFNYITYCSNSFENGADNIQAAQQNQSLETRLVWQLACVARTAARSSQDPLLVTVLNRLDIVERLLTGYFLEPQRIPPPPQNPQDKQNAFWHHLGRFVAARDDTNDPAAQKQVHDSLQAMRGTLEVVETRDVLYSIAICRHIGGRMPDFHPPRHILSSSNNEPNDDSHRLRVAYNFIEMEDQRGNSQVIQRICGMAIRGWVLQKQP